MSIDSKSSKKTRLQILSKRNGIEIESKESTAAKKRNSVYSNY